MKITKTILAVTMVAAVSANAQQPGFGLDVNGGSFLAADGSTVTYSFSGVTLDDGSISGDGVVRTPNQNDITTVIMFSQAVNFFVGDAGAASGNQGFSNTQFDDQFGTATGGITSSFTGNGGTVDLSNFSQNFGSFGDITITNVGGSDISFGTGNVGSTNSGANASTLFGYGSIEGVTQVTFFSADESNHEVFRISATADAIPEPSSAVLLGLGSLAFLTYRRRK